MRIMQKCIRKESATDDVFKLFDTFDSITQHLQYLIILLTFATILIYR